MKTKVKEIKAVTMRQKREGLKVYYKALELRFGKALEIVHPVYANLRNIIAYHIRINKMTKYFEIEQRHNLLFIYKKNRPLWVKAQLEAKKKWKL